MIPARRVFRRGAAAVAAGAVLLAAGALAQESQPWTAIDGPGLRVSSSFPDGNVLSMRAAAGVGAGTFRAANIENRGEIPEPPDRESPTTILGGGLGIAVRPVAGVEAFASSTGWNMKMKNLSPETPVPGEWFANLGDVALGGRLRRALGTYAVGAEVGTLVYGKSGESGSSLRGPEFSATSPFMRGLASWRGVRRGTRVELSANAGLFFDRSWRVWEEVFAEIEAGNRNETHIYPEERRGLGIYGRNGPVTRYVGGLSAAVELDRLAPFLETTFESTDGEGSLRITPGLRYRARPGMLLLAAVDLAPGGAGAHEAIPGEAPLRAHVGFELALGAGRRPAEGPAGRVKVGPTRSTSPYRLHVIDENRRPVADASVWIVDARTGSKVAGPNVTNEDGIAEIERWALESAHADAPYVVRATKRDYAGWVQPRFRHAGTDRVVLYSPKANTLLRIVFKSPDTQLPTNGQFSVHLVPSTDGAPSIDLRTRTPGVIEDRIPYQPGLEWSLVAKAEPSGVNQKLVEPSGRDRFSFSPGSPFLYEIFFDARQGRWSLNAADLVPRYDGPLFEEDLTELLPAETAKLEPLVARVRDDPARRLLITITLRAGRSQVLKDVLFAGRREAISAHLRDRVDPQRLQFAPAVEGAADGVTVEIR